MIKEQKNTSHVVEMRVNQVIFLEKGLTVKDIDLLLMETVALICAFAIEIKDTNVKCSTSYVHGCMHSNS